MRISELVKLLEECKRNNGDLVVWSNGLDGSESPVESVDIEPHGDFGAQPETAEDTHYAVLGWK